MTAATSPAPRFSIMVPTWNNLAMLRLCIESIEKNSAAPHEILIHVNDGSDGTLDWVRSRGYKHTHTPANVGVCWALNMLRPLVTTDHIVFINDDMWMAPGWDTAFADEIASLPDDRYFLASTTVQPLAHNMRPVGVPVADFGRRPDRFRHAELMSYLADLQVPDTMGCVWPPNLVSRRLWDLVGGYSVEFTPGLGSDPDFSAKLWMAGVRHFKTLGRSRCYHFMSASVNRVTKNVGHLQFLRKWGLTPRAFLRYFLMVDEPWTAAPVFDTRSIARERRRCTLKLLLTALQPTHAPGLTDTL